MAITTALKRIADTMRRPSFYKVIQGGMSSGKTYAIMTLLLTSYMPGHPNCLVTVVGQTYGHLEGGAIRDMKNILREVDYWYPQMYNSTSKTLTFPNGSQLEFRSLDNMTARGPRRDVLYVNEANGINYETFQELSGRTKDFTIIDFNPTAEFWAHTELVKKYADRTSFEIFTFADNQAIGEMELENILQHKPKPGEKPSNWWLVYGLGQIGSLEGNIYHGWTKTDKPENAKLVRYGLDFGFSNDETAMVGIYECEDGSYFVEEILYRKGLLGSQYCATLENLGVDGSTLIVADSARPEIIAEIKRGGFRIIGADKNKGSVLRGIDAVAQCQIAYSGKNLEREYYSYAWRKKRSGEVLDEPQDGNDHLMDALRYAIDDMSKQRFDF